MKTLKALSICCVAVGAMLLSGCDVTTPSMMKTGEIQIKDVMKTATLDPAHVDSESVEIISGDYERNGNGPMRLVVPYKPGSPLNKVAAEAQGNQYAKAFAAQGIKDFRVSYAASADSSAMAVLSYMALAAEPPRNCMGHMPGYYGGQTMKDSALDIGCETKTAQSKMISRPADLLGNPGTPDDDARRQGTIVEKYRAGTANPALQGLNASGSAQ